MSYSFGLFLKVKFVWLWLEEYKNDVKKRRLNYRTALTVSEALNRRKNSF